MKKTKKNKGFTLIEILVVIGLIAILAAVVLIAINPAKQFRQANDSQRSANVNAILNAVGQFVADHKGAFPGEGTLPGDEIPSSATDLSDVDGLCDTLVPEYLPLLPVDPKASGDAMKESDCEDYSTKYTIKKDTDGRITIAAPETEEAAEIISVTR